MNRLAPSHHALLTLRLAALMVLLAAPLGAAVAAWQTPDVPTESIATAQATPAPGITATVRNAYFNITAEDISRAIAEQLQLQAVEKKAEVMLAAGSPAVFHSADHPLKLSIHALQIDPNSRRWQAQAYILAGGRTEIVKPISGSYVPMVEVPVLTHQLGRNDIIDKGDLGSKAVPARFVRKDMITDAGMLLGQSPRMIISADRPIRRGEISSPILIKKGSAVQLTYTSDYMSLKATGIALQDGAQGDMIRVKNDKSEKAVSGRVVANGRVEVNTTPAL
ncbi:MAG: flagellar basal body P-ring formation chaperone FlgA [Alphaproteobacteria bacterium]|nr:flagellar basal body P-ring formation chaperone FlgA [Alphaproteobacteria bacterium]